MKLTQILKFYGFALLGGTFYPAAATADNICSFTDWAWHSEEERAVDYQDIRTTRDRLKPAQRHPTLHCSVCKEDQAEVTLSNGLNVSVCAILAEDIERALERSLASGFEVKSLSGYRVGRTRGPLDNSGLRTEYSNHSFGVAIDVNADANGLYDRCEVWGQSCRLRRGGHWDPNHPLSISRDKDIYHVFRAAGFQWGGELNGRQKDFMHFSLTGN